MRASNDHTRDPPCGRTAPIELQKLTKTWNLFPLAVIHREEGDDNVKDVGR